MKQLVSEAIQQLLNENKTPSVALLKAKLDTGFPMPIIIKVLSDYKQNPEAFKKLDEQANTTITTPQQEWPSNQLDRIEAKLDFLLTQISHSQPKER